MTITVSLRIPEGQKPPTWLAAALRAAAAPQPKKVKVNRDHR